MHDILRMNAIICTPNMEFILKAEQYYVVIIIYLELAIFPKVVEGFIDQWIK